jgi:hypothetical protein
MTKINVLLAWVQNCAIISKNRLKIPKLLSEAANRSTDNPMTNEKVQNKVQIIQ